MKRYDDDKQMRSALDVFLFDTLSDPDQEFTGVIPQEAAFADMEPAHEVTIGEYTFSPTKLPEAPHMKLALASKLMQPLHGLSRKEQVARLKIVKAIIESLEG